MKRKFEFFLKDIIECIKSIDNFIDKMDFQKFSSDDKTTSAVIRKIEIIGEATKNIPDTIKERYKEIPWKIRDKVIHSYFGINYETIWNVAKNRLPEIKLEIEKILTDLRDDEMQENLFKKK